MIDDDDVDAAAPFLAHDWELEGVREVGGKLRRCRRCGVLQHWPAAEFSCASALLSAPALSVATQPLHEGQWSGPYAEAPPAMCIVCSRVYRQHVRMTAGKTCSQACSDVNRQKQLAEYRARKRQERQS